MVKVLFKYLGAYGLSNWSDFVYFAVITFAIDVMSALLYFTIDRIQDRHKVMATIMDELRDFITFFLLFESVIITICFWLWWLRLAFNIVGYLVWKKSTALTLTCTIHFILFGFAKAVFKVIDFISKRNKAFNYSKEFIPNLKNGRHV